MITRPITRAHPLGFAGLVRYLAGVGSEDEKLDRLWAVNCLAGDGLDRLEHIINEVEAHQRINTRAWTDKTQHLVVSFPEGEKPPHEVMVAIERDWSEAMGLGGHQRVAATHVNTANFHMHIAYSKVLPTTHKIQYMLGGGRLLAKTRLAIEEKYGLQRSRDVDYGRRPDNPIPSTSKDMEAKTWELSFPAYVLGLRPRLEAALRAAGSWEGLHGRLGEFGLLLKPKGKGLVLADAGHGSRMAKASSLGRDFGKPGLERRLGAFEPAPLERTPSPRMSYGKLPATRHQAQGRLWNEYMEAWDGAAKGKKSGMSWRNFLRERAKDDPLARDIVEKHERRTRRTVRKAGMRR